MPKHSKSPLYFAFSRSHDYTLLDGTTSGWTVPEGMTYLQFCVAVFPVVLMLGFNTSK
jgi:hypothetical protein